MCPGPEVRQLGSPRAPGVSIAIVTVGAGHLHPWCSPIFLLPSFLGGGWHGSAVTIRKWARRRQDRAGQRGLPMGWLKGCAAWGGRVRIVSGVGGWNGLW